MKNTQWAEERQARIAHARDLLADGVRALQSSNDWTELLRRIARNTRVRFGVTRYSFMNQMLVWAQAPHATATAGYRQWQTVGRQVRKGEKGIVIVQPRPWKRETTDDDGNEVSTGGMSFGSVFVFDVSQTDGPPLEELPSIVAGLAPEEVFSFSYERLRDVALGLEGAPVAAIDVRPRMSDDPDANGWYVRSSRAVVVIDNGNPTEMFRTLAHEVAHAILHGAGDRHDTSTKEVEAESVAFIVAHAAGLDTAPMSFPYVAHWAGTRDAAQAVLASGDRITKAASRILDALFGSADRASAEAA